MTVQDLKDMCDRALKEGATELEDIRVEYTGDSSSGDKVYRVELLYKTNKGYSLCSSFHDHIESDIPLPNSMAFFEDLDEEEKDHIDFVRKNCGAPLP